MAADGNAGLAVTIDIGNRDDIHPTNKQDVGRGWRARRATWCMARRFRRPARSLCPRRGRVATSRVTLGDFDGDLLVIGARDPSGFELCGATQDSCRFVRAQLAGGGKVLLTDAAARERDARALLLGRQPAVQSLRQHRSARGAV